MKKGISLIVLVITIIVIIIIAGAIILSLSDSNVISKANYSTLASNRSNLQTSVATKAGEIMADKQGLLTSGDQAALNAVIAAEVAKEAAKTTPVWVVSLEKKDPDDTDEVVATEVTYTGTAGNTEAVLLARYAITELPTWMRGSDYTP